MYSNIPSSEDVCDTGVVSYALWTWTSSSVQWVYWYLPQRAVTSNEQTFREHLIHNISANICMVFTVLFPNEFSKKWTSYSGPSDWAEGKEMNAYLFDG